jgi:hypothetical protein
VRRFIASGVAFACMAGAPLRAAADDVHLSGGTTIEGKAVRQGDKVVVELESGQITFSANDVERIDRRESSVELVDRRYAALKADDVSGRLALADYCRDHDMHAREQALLQEVIQHAPDNVRARSRLGFVKTDAGWVTHEAQMRAQGMVQRDGAWVTQAQALELDRLHAQADTALRERERAQTELEAQKLELRKRQLELDTERARAEQAAKNPPAQNPTYYTSPAYGFGFGYGYGVATPACRPGHACGAVPPPSNPHPFPINGVRDPRDGSWPMPGMPGVRNPRSY